MSAPISSPSRPRAGRPSSAFTLVELLVVIGVIGLLISILLPSLNQARRAAIGVKCLSNERTIGQAFVMYANDNRGKILPACVFGGTSATPDYWPFLLIAGKYLPDPHTPPGTGPASDNNVLVCPAVRGLMSYNDTVSPVAGGAVTDGFSRRFSRVLMTDAEQRDDPVTHRAAVVDIGYGVNGVQQVGGMMNDTGGGTRDFAGQPMQGIAGDVAAANPALRTYYRAHVMTDFRQPSRTVVLFDGGELFCYTGPAPYNHLWRISGTRHGKSRNAGADQDLTYASGTCNVLFLDGHAQPVDRAALPGKPDSGFFSTQIIGTRDQMTNSANPGVTNEYVWNTKQQ